MATTAQSRNGRSSKRYQETLDQPRVEKGIGADNIRRLRRLSSIAALMDTAVGIPLTRFRVGADSVFGLVPGIGDAAGTLIGLYLVNEARRLGLPKDKLARMLTNVGIDFVGGAVPLLGDLFDAYFKSNKRNVDLVLDHFGVSRDDLGRSARRKRQRG